jgi:PIN domain nuclease of toxin-antitoxin system
MLHKEPFDRLLVAQALFAGMVIVTADEQIKKYDVRTIW